MKRTANLIITACMLILTSCMTDLGTDRIKSGTGPSAPVEIDIATRVFADLNDPDYNVSGLRVMAFAPDGTIKSNVCYDDSQLGDAPFVRHRIYPGTYDFVIIANEPTTETVPELQTVSRKLWNVTTKSELAGIDIPGAMFSCDLDIPMIGTVNAVTVLPGNGGVTGPNVVKNSETGYWTVPLDRLAVRVDMLLLSENDLTDEFLGVTFSNLPTHVPLLGGVWSGAHTGSRSFTVEDDPASFSNTVTTEELDGKEWGMKVVRVILPSYLFESGTEEQNKARALNITLNMDGTDLPGTMVATERPDLTYPKNSHIEITGKVDYAGGYTYTANVVPWNQIGISARDGVYYLYVSTGKLEYAYTQSSKDLTLTTNYQGWRAKVYSDAACTNDITTTGWVTITPSSSAASVPGGTTVNITAADNTNKPTRTAYIKFTAGRMATIVEVAQADNPPAVDPVPGEGSAITMTPYVGAFWKAGQTGERVISMSTETAAYAGHWAVQVLEYGAGFREGDIVFLAGGSDDPMIYGSTPGDAESFQVNSTAVYAMGTATTGTGIKFRIGLKSKWDSSNPNYVASQPARYARIVLSFGNNNYQYKRVLWLRQGHEPDYLMRPGDAGTGVSGRTLAVKYSPYNLTASAFNGGGTTTESVNVGARGGVLTDYPTQGGAFFQWAVKSGGVPSVTAYNPAVPASTAVSGWSLTYENTSYWNTLKSSYESCPSGYRRPADGSTTSSVSVSSIAASASEQFQSLFVNPKTNTSSNVGNSSWGYYADGFFDRHATGQQAAYSGGIANSAVATGSSTVAYQGRLFYNPNNNASLFFPASGGRYYDTSYLYNPGTSGYYWSGSAVGTDTGVTMYIDNSNASRGNNTRYAAFSVRCVKE